MKLLSSILLTALLSISGCASYPEFNRQDVNLQLTPQQASDSGAQSRGKKVIWGGMILAVKNLQTTTQLEVLAYPLSSKHMPDPQQQPTGRFLLNKAGYLEAADYASGRYISVLGTISGVKRSKIGESDYNYPLLEAENLYLWPKNFEANQSNVHFGFGISISR